MEEMQNKEIVRTILKLREEGWDDTKIINFILYIETGEEHNGEKIKEQ